MHPDVDQFLRIEQGKGITIYGIAQFIEMDYYFLCLLNGLDIIKYNTLDNIPTRVYCRFINKEN